MRETNPYENAFPTQGNSASGELEGGLTKREYFAAKAMQGILAGRSVTYFDIEQGKVAEYAVKFADALLKQLSQ